MRPLPASDAFSAPFFEGLPRGELMIQQCPACGLKQLGQDRCLNCRAEPLAWTRARPEGRVHSFTVMHAVFHPAFAGEVPYVVALVELTDGPRLLGDLRNVAPDQVRVGMDVRVTTTELAPGAFAPVFEAVGEE